MQCAITDTAVFFRQNGSLDQTLAVRFGVLGDGFGAGDVGLLLSMPAAVASLVANFGFAGMLGRTLLFYLIY